MTEMNIAEVSMPTTTSMNTSIPIEQRGAPLNPNQVKKIIFI